MHIKVWESEEEGERGEEGRRVKERGAREEVRKRKVGGRGCKIKGRSREAKAITHADMNITPTVMTDA